MRVAALANIWPPTFIHSHQLSSTLNWFKFWWEFVHVWPVDSHQLSPCLTSASELGELSCKLSLLNSHLLSSSFDQASSEILMLTFKKKSLEYKGMIIWYYIIYVHVKLSGIRQIKRTKNGLLLIIWATKIWMQ